MFKFNRKYKLVLDTNEVGADGKVDTIEIELPYTLEFNIKKNNLASANTGSFKIYNLSEKIRNRIYRDYYDIKDYRRIELYAGYAGIDDKNPALALVFRGNITQAFSYRENTEFITEIEAFDGGFGIINTFTSKTIASGQTQKKTLDALINDLTETRNISKGVVGDFQVSNQRGRVLEGNTYDLLKTESDDKVFIENETINIMKDNEVLEKEISLISSESGLFDSPRRTDAMLSFNMLFEPKLKINQIIKLESKTNSIFNGEYKIMGYNHSGIISDAVSGSCRTQVNLWLGTEPFRVISK